MKKEEILTKAIELIKSFGLKCYIHDYKYPQLLTYCYVTDGVNICYIEVDNITYWLHISTIHKPSVRNGDGFL